LVFVPQAERASTSDNRRDHRSECIPETSGTGLSPPHKPLSMDLQWVRSVSPDSETLHEEFFDLFQGPSVDEQCDQNFCDDKRKQ
jgi:hypothetical protein